MDRFMRSGPNKSEGKLHHCLSRTCRNQAVLLTLVLTLTVPSINYGHPGEVRPRVLKALPRRTLRAY